MSDGRHDVRSGLGVGQRHLRQQFERGVIHDLASLDDPAVPGAGVLAQADIGHDQQIGGPLLDRADRLLHHALFRPRLGALLVFVRGQAKQQYGGDAKFGDLGRFLRNPVRREMETVGHRGNRLLQILARSDKERIDQIINTQRRLAHHPSHRRTAAQPPHPDFRKTHGTLQLSACRVCCAHHKSIRRWNWCAQHTLRLFRWRRAGHQPCAPWLRHRCERRTESIPST